MILSPNKENIALAAKALRNNQLIGMPTETVYGLAGNALSKDVVLNIYKLKGRPSSNPLIVHIADTKKINSLTANLTNQQIDYLEKLQQFWPGPLTIILPKHPDIPLETTAGNESIAIRIPKHPLALEIIKLADLPLAAPSANRSNYISPTSALHVEQEFGAELPIVIDGGNCQIGLESTVLSLVELVPTILRPGAITFHELKKIIPDLQIRSENINQDHQQTSPGQQIKHYSPKTKLIFRKEFDPKLFKTQKIGCVAFQPLSDVEQKDFNVFRILSEDSNFSEIAQKLFATLRELDEQNLDLILIDSCPEEDLGMAIMDRLKRATR